MKVRAFGAEDRSELGVIGAAARSYGLQLHSGRSWSPDRCRPLGQVAGPPHDSDGDEIVKPSCRGDHHGCPSEELRKMEDLLKKPTIFISYSHTDSQFVDWLADELKASGVDVWIDKWKIKVGDSIIQRINEGIGTSDFLIVVLSRASVNSLWVREELNAATIKNIEQEKRAFILPVLVEECEIPSLLRHRRYANFKDAPEQAFRELLGVIRQPTKPRAGPSTAKRTSRLGQ